MKDKGIRIMRVAVFCVFAAVALPALAKSVYIDDELRVGVRAEPDNSQAPVGVVTTGMKLEVLERAPGYMKIRSDKGLQGWIRDIYTTDNPPAALELKEARQKQARLESRLNAQTQSIKVMQHKNAGLSERNKQLQAQIENLQREFMKSGPAGANRHRMPQWSNWLLAIVLAIGTSFVLGIAWQRHRTIKRLSGLRV